MRPSAQCVSLGKVVLRVRSYKTMVRLLGREIKKSVAFCKVRLNFNRTDVISLDVADVSAQPQLWQLVVSRIKLFARSLCPLLSIDTTVSRYSAPLRHSVSALLPSSIQDGCSPTRTSIAVSRYHTTESRKTNETIGNLAQLSGTCPESLGSEH